MENLNFFSPEPRPPADFINQEITTLGDEAKVQELPPGLMALFREVEGQNPGKGYAVEKVPLTLGRDALCDVSITDTRMSRQHAMLFYYAPHFYLKDLGSTNGTFVNDKRIKQAILQNGDKVKMGGTTLEFIVSKTAPAAT